MMGVPLSTKDFIAAHLETSIPKGARNIPQIPITMYFAMCGSFSKIPSISSISRLPIWCSVVPTHRNIKDFAIAWKIIRKIPAQTASAVPMPPQATIRPRFAIVE